MRILKAALALVAFLVVGAGALTFWISSAMVPIPDLGQPTQGDSHVYTRDLEGAVEEAQARFVDMRSRLNAPAVSIAVSLNGELLWAEAQGYADVTTQEPVTINSRFHMGSIAKTFTAAVAMQLSEEGLLDLDADIQDYLPNYPARAYPVTTRQLLSHQAGIRHYGFAPIPPLFQERGRNVQFDTVTDSLEVFSDDPLLFEPDTDFQYSTYGYTLASAVMEAAGGTDLLSLMEVRLFAPLGMDDTLPHDDTNPNAARVSGYISYFPGDDVIDEPQTNSSYKWAGGGYLSTPTDLVRFGEALLAGEIIGAGSVETMMTSRTLTNGEPNPQRYGLGLRQGGMYYPSNSENIIPFISHGGTTIGVVSVLVLLPESGLVIAMAANSAGAGGSSHLTGEAAGMARIFLDHMGFVPEGFAPEPVASN